MEQKIIFLSEKSLEQDTPGINKRIFYELEIFISSIGIKADLIDMGTISDLSFFTAQFKKEDEFIGFIFHSHGERNKVEFPLSLQTPFIDGREFAYFLAKTLPLEQLSPNFFFHFLGCDLGITIEKSAGFQQLFITSFLLACLPSNYKPQKISAFAFKNSMGPNVHKYIEFGPPQANHSLNSKAFTDVNSIFQKWMSEKSFKNYVKSPGRRFFSWHLFFAVQGYKGFFVLLCLFLLAATSFAFIFKGFTKHFHLPLALTISFLISSYLHLWAFRNWLISRREATAFIWTPQRSFIEMGSITTLFQSWFFSRLPKS